MTRIITITGGKGGVGKTSISLNLALCLSKLEAKVCLFDADLGLANVNILLGLYPEYDLEDVICQQKSISDIIIHTYQGIDIIPGSSGVEKLANLEPKELDHIVHAFSNLEEYDYFLFDTSSGITQSVISFCLASSEVIIVITPEPTSLTDAYALLKVLCVNHFSGSVKIVVNQCKNTKIASRTYSKFKEVVQKYLTVDLSPLGVIVQDARLPESVKKQQPLVTLFPESNAAKCIRIMASRLAANQSEKFERLKLGSFWSRFLNLSKSSLDLSNEGANRITGEKKKAEQPAVSTDAPNGPAASPRLWETKDTGREEDASRKKTKPSVPDSDNTAAKKTVRFAPRQMAAERKTDTSFDRFEFSKNLPSLPQILLKLMETCSREDATVNELAKIVAKDPSLSSKILKLVNSAYYNLPQKIHNFEQAISLLGMEAIKNLALSASVYQVFDDMEKNSRFDLRKYWFHSLQCAVLANMIAKRIAYPFCEEAFVAGLLHDVGKLVLWKNYPEAYAKVLADVQKGDTLIHAEDRILGFNHAAAGACLIEHWQMEAFIADAFLYHHEPMGRILNALPMVKIVYVANCLSADCFEDAARLKIAADVLGLDAGDVKELLDQSGSKVNHVAQSLGIAIETDAEGDDLLDHGRKVQDELVRRVRDLSLLQGTLQNLLNARDINTILSVARQGLQIIFDIKKILFFLYDADENVLVNHEPTPMSQDAVIRELTIPVQENRGLVVACLEKMVPVDSFTKTSDTAMTILDEQIIRLLNRDGMVCFPMAAKKNYVGVMVLGVDKQHLSHVAENSNLLSMFANYSALAIHSETIHQAQAKRVVSERLAASTAIARKVAHEVNNPLSIIKNYLKILEIKLSDQNIPSDEIKIVNDEISRVSMIIEELSDFSKPRIQSLEPVAVNTLLEDIAKISRDSLLQNRITLHLELDSGIPQVVTAKNSLKQVFLNLVKNAAEAIHEDGNIFIKTAYDKQEPDDSLNQDDHIVIQVRDDGPGLPSSIESRLFEPFVSTKGDEHAGLGLSIVYKIVKELKGTISCRTEKGRGTAFTISLPFKPEN